MFKNPLSFKGRIRRTEYGISLIISVVYYTVLQLVIPAIFMSQYIGYGYVRKDIMADTMGNIMITYCLFAIPMIYFSYAQAAKLEVTNMGQTLKTEQRSPLLYRLWYLLLSQILGIIMEDTILLEIQVWELLHLRQQLHHILRQ